MTTLKKISLIASFFLFIFSSQIFSEPDQLQKEILDNLPPDQRAQVMERMKLIEDQQSFKPPTPAAPYLPDPQIANMFAQNINPTTRLTDTETALLSPEEQIIRQRSRRI